MLLGGLLHQGCLFKTLELLVLKMSSQQTYMILVLESPYLLPVPSAIVANTDNKTELS